MSREHGLVEFTQAVKPYLSNEERYNDMYPTASDMLNNSLQRINTKTKLSNVELVSEYDYSIEGLLPPTQEISKRRKQ